MTVPHPYSVGTVGSFLLLLVLHACGSGDGEERSGIPDFCRDALADMESFEAEFSEPEGERFGGTVVVGAIGDLADGMNSLVTADHGSAQHQAFVNQMTLVQVDSQLEPEPYLARSWDWGEEGSEVTFHLRDDVHWHDGRLTTAYDVEFTYLRATDPETAFPNSGYWTHYVRGAEGVEVVDSFTVRFQMEPHAESLEPWRSLAIMPRHLLEDVPSGELRRHPFGTRCPVGNGPFRFVEYRPGDRWVFERNPSFPQDLGGAPYLDRYVYRVIPEPSTLLAELLTEGVDVYLQPTTDQFPRIEGEDHLELLTFPFRDYAFVAWNTRRPQLADARVRRAITLATDRARIVEAILGERGSVANSGVPPFHWAHDPGLVDSLAYDPAEAERLLEEAGWTDVSGDGVREGPDGIRLEITITYNVGNQQRQEIAEIMQAQLGEVGISVRPEAVEWASLVERITDPDRRDFDGVVLAWVSGFRVDDSSLFHSSSREAPYGWAGLEDAELDQLLDTLQLVLDREQALPLWDQYQQRVMDLQPFTYFYFRDRAAGLNRRLRDVDMDPRGEWVSIAQWWIPEDERRGAPRVARRE